MFVSLVNNVSCEKKLLKGLKIWFITCFKEKMLIFIVRLLQKKNPVHIIDILSFFCSFNVDACTRGNKHTPRLDIFAQILSLERGI